MPGVLVLLISARPLADLLTACVAQGLTLSRGRRNAGAGVQIMRAWAKARWLSIRYHLMETDLNQIFLFLSKRHRSSLLYHVMLETFQSYFLLTNLLVDWRDLALTMKMN